MDATFFHNNVAEDDFFSSLFTNEFAARHAPADNDSETSSAELLSFLKPAPHPDTKLAPYVLAPGEEQQVIKDEKQPLAPSPVPAPLPYQPYVPPGYVLVPLSVLDPEFLSTYAKIASETAAVQLPPIYFHQEATPDTFPHDDNHPHPPHHHLHDTHALDLPRQVKSENLEIFRAAPLPDTKPPVSVKRPVDLASLHNIDDNVSIEAPKIRRYNRALPSRFCHLCARSVETVNMVPCFNIKYGVCRKVICERCVDENGLRTPGGTNQDRFVCSHCRGSCPEKAQCNTYKKTNKRRRLNGLIKRKQLEQVLATGGDISGLLDVNPKR